MTKSLCVRCLLAWSLYCTTLLQKLSEPTSFRHTTAFARPAAAESCDSCHRGNFAVGVRIAGASPQRRTSPKYRNACTARSALSEVPRSDACTTNRP